MVVVTSVVLVLAAVGIVAAIVVAVAVGIVVETAEVVIQVVEVINNLKTNNMKVTREILSCQGFDNEMGDKTGKFVLYSKVVDEKFCIVSWVDEMDTLAIQFFPNIADEPDRCEMVKKLVAIKMLLKVHNNDWKPDGEDPSIVFFGKIPHMVALFSVLVEYGVVMNGAISVPKDIDEMFLNSDFNYDEETFEMFSKMLVNLFNEFEDYEKSSKVWNHYIKVKEEKNWTNSSLEIA